MSFNRPRRAQAPSSLHPSNQPSKPTLNVEEWEAKARLGDLEIRSVNAVKGATENVPFPLKFSKERGDEDDESLRVATPIATTTTTGGGNKLVAGSRPATPSGSSPAPPRGQYALCPKQPVHTTQQLYDWFALIDRSVAHSQEAHFRAHVASVSEHLDTCDLLLERVDEIEKEIGLMWENWRSVEEGGKSLKDACERLLEERDKLIELTDDIGVHLEYFQQLDLATRMLNHPGEQLIYQGDFLYMVEKVDICIEFLRARRHFKEAEVYLLRFQQCMTRAMTLIKMNFVGSLRALSGDISRRLSDKDVSQTAQMHLLYTRFRSVAAKVSPLLGELERRAQAYPDDLSTLLAECHSAYFSTRKALLVPKIMEEIKGLDPSRSELVELTRAGCSYLKQLCTDEFNLYREFFSTAEDQLYQYLETLCDLLYDDLRPRILHEPRLTALCEVCTVLQALMVLDAPIASPAPGSSSLLFSSSVIGSSSASGDDGNFDDASGEGGADDEDEDDDDDTDELTVDLDQPHWRRKNGLVGRRLHIRHLLQMVLQDAQTRLFFKAQAVIQSEIRYYVPKVEDLAWPDVIVAANHPRTGIEIREKEIVSRIFKASLAQQETWYPTVRKMVWVLSQLHDFVKPAIFEDIAQEAALLCRQSLLSATELIKARPPPSTPLDGHLFLVRHLLILKDVAKSLELEGKDAQAAGAGAGASGYVLSPVSPRRRFAVSLSPSGKESGFGGFGDTSGGGVAGTLTTMFNRTTSILPEGLFASLGVTRSDESMRGVKHGIDHDLRRACEEVISACVNPICEPLDEWVMKVHTYSRASGSARSMLPIPSARPGSSAAPLSGAAAAGGNGAPSSSSSTADPSAWTSIPHVSELYLNFRSACERDLRANITRIKLYLGDADADSEGAAEGQAHYGRTARVLVEHVRERLGEGYRGFVEQAREVLVLGAPGLEERQEGERALREMESESGMRAALREISGPGEGVVVASGSGR